MFAPAAFRFSIFGFLCFLMLRVRFQLDSALARLASLLGALDGPERLLQPAAAVVARAIERNFEEEGRPAPWQPLSPRYERWKTAHFPGRGILELTGRLRRSIRTRIEAAPDGSAAVVASTDVSYAPFHQFGAPAGNLPARPFFVLTDEDREEVAQAIAQSLSEL